MGTVFKTRVATNGTLQVSLTALCKMCAPNKKAFNLLATEPAKALAQAVAKKYNLSDGEVILRECTETWVHWVLAAGISARISSELTIAVAEFLAHLKPPEADERTSHELALGEPAAPSESLQTQLVHAPAALQATRLPPSGDSGSRITSWSGSWHNGYPVFRYGKSLLSEDDLHFSVVKTLRAKCPDLYILPSLGEIAALSDDIRKLVGSRGYTKGSPDLFVMSSLPHMGKLAIELKAPRHGIQTSDAESRLSGEQAACHRQLRACGWDVVVSSNYEEILERVTEVQREVSAYRDLVLDSLQDLGTFQLVEYGGSQVLWQHTSSNSVLTEGQGLPIVTGTTWHLTRRLLSLVNARAQKRPRPS